MKMRNISGDFSQKNSKFKERVFNSGITFVLDRKRYDLAKDVAFFSILEESEKTSVGKSVAKVALAGMAGNATGNNAFGTAAMLGTAAIGINNRHTIFIVLFYLESGKRFVANIDGKTIQKLAEYVTQIPREKVNKAIADLKRERRFFEDAPRTIIETENAIEKISEDLRRSLLIEEHGESFDERDTAGIQARKLESILEEKRDLHRRLSLHLADGTSIKTKTKIQSKNQAQENTRTKAKARPETTPTILDRFLSLAFRLLVIVFLVAFPPLGIYLMFRGQVFYRSVRWLITIALIALMTAIISYEPDHSYEPSRSLEQHERTKTK